MIEPPSKQLRETLLRLRICTAADFRRAKRRVRRLARDLPAFDFIWIDSLLNLRRLTPFQARLLETNKADRLSVGSYVLLDRMGESQKSATYLARPIDRADRVVLKMLDPSSESITASIAGLEDLAHRLNGLSHPSIAAPHAVFEHERKLVLVSRYIPGPHLGALLVRRGRFPAPVVAEIARQLIDGLAEMESRDCIHGDLALNNIRLTSAGAVVLVDAGIRPATAPELIIQANRHPDRYDGIAPELIGTGAAPTFASDIYALGCVLWHLLAGRPPHSTGDPLGKLAAHQTKQIVDIRELAPDTPADLADAIALFTKPEPSARPVSFREIRKEWGVRRNTKKQVAQFLAGFDAEAPDAPGPAKAGFGLWAFAVVGMFVLTGAALTLFDLGSTNSTLRISGRVTDAINRAKEWAGNQSAKATPDTPAKSNDKAVAPEPIEFEKPVATPPAPAALATLPAPDRDGVVHLESGTSYEAESINAVGPLAIQGNIESPPEIVITKRPFQVAARELLIQDVNFRWADPVAAEKSGEAAQPRRPATLLLAQSQQLTVIGCTFLSSRFAAGAEPELEREPGKPAANTVQLIGVAWKPLDALDRAGGGVHVSHSVFAGMNSALHIAGKPTAIEYANSLQVAGGTLLSLASGIGSGRELPVRVRNVTLRDVESLIRLRTSGNPRQVPRIALAAESCVFNIHGPGAAIFQILGDRNPRELQHLVTMTGDGSVANAYVHVTAWIKPNAPQAEYPELDNIEVEGVSATTFQFAGPIGISAAQSMLDPKSIEASPSASNLPGVDAVALQKRTAQAESVESRDSDERAEGPNLGSP